MSDNSLPRVERLRSLTAIRRLFVEGESGFVYPFRYMFRRDSEEQGGAEVLFSVPKKYHKRANKRNLLKRRSREAYRLNKSELQRVLAERGVALDLAIVYSTKDILSYKTIEYAVQRILGQICGRL